MKRLVLILLSVGVYAKLEVVAFTHADCPVCQRWHKEVEPNYAMEAKQNHYPELKSYDLADSEGKAFLLSKVGYVNYIPMFVVMEDELVLSSFDGYTEYKMFFKALEKALAEAKVVQNP